MDYAIVCAFAYIVLVGLCYMPRNTEASAPVDYFPEIPEVEAIANEPEQEPISIKPEILPVKSVTAKTAPATAPNDLSGLTIRSLKRLASRHQIKGYSSLTKSQLISSLQSLAVPIAA